MCLIIAGYSESGYVCMVFYRRDGHVIELQQTSNFAPAADEACHPNNFNPLKLPFITLISEFDAFWCHRRL
jgi:hypothetical protein